MFEELKHELATAIKGSISDKLVIDSNGIERDQYLNSHQLLSDATILKKCAETLLSSIASDEIDALVGLALGGCALTGAICAATADQKKPLYSAMFRDRPKTHGYPGMLNCPILPNQNICIVDDVISTGSSVIRAVDHLRELDVDVSGVLSVVRRGDEGILALENIGLQVVSLIDIYDVIER